MDTVGRKIHGAGTTWTNKKWRLGIYGGFLQWWYPTTMGFPTKNDHFEVFWGYHHLRKHPYIKTLLETERQILFFADKSWEHQLQHQLRVSRCTSFQEIEVRYDHSWSATHPCGKWDMHNMQWLNSRTTFCESSLNDFIKLVSFLTSHIVTCNLSKRWRWLSEMHQKLSSIPPKIEPISKVPCNFGELHWTWISHGWLLSYWWQRSGGRPSVPKRSWTAVPKKE